MGLFDFLILLVAAGLFAVVWQLRKLNSQMRAIANQIGNRDADSVHDVTHPVFSVQQLRRTRQRFEIEYRTRLQLETELYDTSDWRSRSKSADVSLQLLERLRAICEASVQCECAWKEYVWMVEGNLSVAADRESRTAILQGFRDLLARTRGTPVVMTFAPNSEKVRRVEEILTNWTARLTGATTEAVTIEMPDMAEKTFDVAIEERNH
jgi:hypothetical protein